MEPITFITSNQGKADYLAKYLGVAVQRRALDLDEVQSLDLKTIVEHKVRQAYAQLQSPVLVDDVALEFTALGRLPGPFIRFFLEEMWLQAICDLVHGKSRKAIARCVLGYFDGTMLKLFEGKLDGEVAPAPAGEGGFGWDKIFIPAGYTVTRASLSEEDDRKTYLQIKPLAAVKEFLMQHSAPV